MSAEQRRSHIWHAIIRNAFSPSDAGTQAKWLNCFSQTIYKCVDNPVLVPPNQHGELFSGKVGCCSLDFTCEYQIGRDRSQFDFFLSSLPFPSWHSQYGIETTMFACGAHEMEKCREPPRQDEVDEVLRGLISHPRSHLHLSRECPMREVRIGTGLHAPFLFLFQIRFQLCIDTARRQQEMDRLSRMFSLEWLKHERAISPPTLFGL